jgi:hypothetical protein
MTENVATLAQLEQLRQRVRLRVRHGAWFPAAIIAGFLLLSMVLYTSAFADPFTRQLVWPAWAGLPDEQRDPLASYLFWFLGTPAVVAAVGWWYRRRARELGIRVEWKWLALAALGTLILLGLLAAVPTSHAGQTSPPVDAFPVPLPPMEMMPVPFLPPWARGFFTPIMALMLAVIALARIERSRWLVFAGLWIGLLAWWQGAFGMGILPPWATFVLNGFEPSLGGQWTLFGLHRPGPLLILMALPLAGFAVVRAARAVQAR